jgi:O-antigen/teichoic acid export membrane protein
MLSVAELGVGSAITFCMYKPIVEGRSEVVSALYHLFKKLYLLIGCVIFCTGLTITPFLRFFAKDYAEIDVNMHVTFLLLLTSVTATYLYSAKTSLINAYKNNYITTAITQGGLTLLYVLQVLALYVTRSFICYLICRIITVLIQMVVTQIVTKRNYAAIIETKAKLDAETAKTVTKNIKAMFIHKIGYVLVNTVDSVVISSFVGVISLGEYSNYTMVLTSMTGIITLVFTSLTSVIGHLCVEEDRTTARKYCESFHLLNFFIGTVFFLGYYAVIDNLIAILFSADLVVTRDISLVITLNGFVQFMRRNTLTFRDATGSFYSDRWKSLFEGTLNIVLSILLVNHIGVTGVIVATIITNLLICHIVEPYVLYKNAFESSVYRYYLKNYSMILTFAIALLALNTCVRASLSGWGELLLNGVTSLAVSAIVCAVWGIFSRKETAQLAKILRKG